MNRESLRELARELLSSPASEHLPRARELIAGGWCLLDEFEWNGRRYFVATASRASARLSIEVIQMLHRRASGASIKEIAIDAGLSEATVSRRLQRAMGELGLSGQPQLARFWAAVAEVLAT